MHEYFNPLNEDKSVNHVAVARNQSSELVDRGILRDRIADGFMIDSGYLSKEKRGIGPKIVVDRSIDPNLRSLIQETIFIKELLGESVGTVESIAELIADRMEYAGSREDIIQRYNDQARLYSGSEILLGDFIAGNRLYGLCLQRSLLFQVLAKEAGLDVALRIGTHGGVGHAWNELSVDGDRYIVEAFNPPPFLQKISVFDHRDYTDRYGRRLYANPWR